jgi:hypothetical protein
MINISDVRPIVLKFASEFVNKTTRLVAADIRTMRSPYYDETSHSFIRQSLSGIQVPGTLE